MRKPLAIAACLSLLSLQLGGVHVHADDGGYIGIPETTFTHSHHHHGDAHHDEGHDSAGHPSDHEDATDVSLLELALGVLKLPLAMPALLLLFAIVPLIRALAGADFVHPVLSGRYTRWRPPLRAPPQPA